MTATIRRMTPADVAEATELIVRGDWGDRRTWFEFVTTQAECRPIVAEADGRIVGTGCGTINGSVGWVGTIFVEGERRGEGLGRALTAAACEELEAAGCRTLLLVSTGEGLRLYRSMGFETQTTYRILEAPGLPADPGEAARSGAHRDRVVRPFEPGDLPAMAALDRLGTGEDRAHVLRRFADAGSAKVLAGSDGTVTGFVVRAPWGGGATIAATSDDAIAILTARRLASGPAGRVRVGLVEDNVEGLRRLAAEGLKPIWKAPRMLRGEPLDWRPAWIWGQFNHAMG